MRVHNYLVQFACTIGVFLVAASWTENLSPIFGWTGLVIAVVGAVILYAPRRDHLESTDGVPVAPTGIWVQPHTPLEAGSRVLAFSQGQWWRARVIALEAHEERVRINFIGWDPRYEESHRRSQLQLDEDLDPPPDPPADWPQPPALGSDTNIQRK